MTDAHCRFETELGHLPVQEIRGFRKRRPRARADIRESFRRGRGFGGSVLKIRLKPGRALSLFGDQACEKPAIEAFQR
jgi:hypothetical protein